MSIDFSSPNPPDVKRCPFCGSKAMITGGGHRRFEKIPFRIECSNRLCGVVTGPHSTEGLAVEVWNSRVDYG